MPWIELSYAYWLSSRVFISKHSFLELPAAFYPTAALSPAFSSVPVVGLEGSLLYRKATNS